jgi:uncharacterized protein YggT (Ycf19 family)
MNIIGLPPQILIAFINLVANLVEGLLLLRMTLKLFGARTVAPFVSWVYQTTDPLLTPFAGMFPTPSLTGGFVIEFSSLFALMVYAFIGYASVELIGTLAYRGQRRKPKTT